MAQNPAKDVGIDNCFKIRIRVRLRTVPVSNDPVGSAYLSQFPALHKLPHFTVNAIGSLIHHNTELHVMRFCTGVHFQNLLGIYAGRFFNENVQTVFHSKHGIFRMVVMGYADEKRVNKTAFHHFQRIGKYGKIFSRKFSRIVQPIGFQITNSGKIDFGAFSVNDSFDMVSTYIPNAENTEIDFFHDKITVPFLV